MKTLPSDDLSVNLLVFGPGEGVAEHENREEDAGRTGARSASSRHNGR